MTIHASSYHPPSKKYTVYNSMFYRLLNILQSQENYIEELNIIKHIASANSFLSSMIDNLIYKHKQKITETRTKEVLKVIKYLYAQ